MVADMDLLARYAVALWLIVAAVGLLLEVVTNSGWLIWPAGSAALTGAITRVWFFDPKTQVVIFVCLTLISTLVGRRLTALPARRRGDPEEAFERLIGLAGVTTTTFKDGLGRVRVDGREWPAELEDSGQMRRGTKIYVVAIKNGPRLRVRRPQP